MALAPGSRLGAYEVLAPLGTGGMGEVWKARDTRLGREVALKTLPDEFASDADRLARFEREAKLLASLNHPNIGGIYGLETVQRLRPHRAEDEEIRGPVSASVRAGGGAPAPLEDDDRPFLVLELVAGPTLADRLKRGAIPVEDALQLALQIVEALEAAHEKGVIHRDLKPANIKVTPEGMVKVLDFGLAKAFGGEQAEANLSQSPTLSMAATQGIILGTAAYMSPEQAKGRTIDKRTDVWAFGCVLYEMRTGARPFEREDLAETMAAVMSSSCIPGTAGC